MNSDKRDIIIIIITSRSGQGEKIFLELLFFLKYPEKWHNMPSKSFIRIRISTKKRHFEKYLCCILFTEADAQNNWTESASSALSLSLSLSLSLFVCVRVLLSRARSR
jgi:hypothetical protein